MTNNISTPAPLLVDAETTSRLCDVSGSTWWSLHAAGRVPLPVRLGPRALWVAAELAEWTNAWSPPRDRWEAMKGARP